MKTVLDIAKLLAYVALIILLGECAFAVHRLRPQAEATLTDVRRTVVIVAGAATNVEQGARSWKKASEEQSRYATDALGSVKETTASIQTLVKRTDASLNDLVLPSLAASVKEQSQSLSETQAKLRESLTGLTDSNKELQKDLVKISETFAGPEVKESLQNTAEATKNTAVATKNLAETTQEVKVGVTYEVNELMKPVKKVKVVSYFIARLVGKFLGF